MHKSAKGSEVKGHYNSLITSVLERKELSFPPPSLWGTLGIYLGQNPLRKVVTTYVLPVIRARDGFSPVLIFPTHYLLCCIPTQTHTNNCLSSPAFVGGGKNLSYAFKIRLLSASHCV